MHRIMIEHELVSNAACLVEKVSGKHNKDKIYTWMQNKKNENWTI